MTPLQLRRERPEAHALHLATSRRVCRCLHCTVQRHPAGKKRQQR